MATKFTDAFVAYFSEVVADIRSKLIDEGWFQRQRAEPDHAQHLEQEGFVVENPPGTLQKIHISLGPEDLQALGEAFGWPKQDKGSGEPGRADPDHQDDRRDVHGNDHEHGIDR